jgi:hypothetical protein
MVAMNSHTRKEPWRFGLIAIAHAIVTNLEAAGQFVPAGLRNARQPTISWLPSGFGAGT